MFLMLPFAGGVGHQKDTEGSDALTHTSKLGPRLGCTKSNIV